MPDRAAAEDNSAVRRAREMTAHILEPLRDENLDLALRRLGDAVDQRVAGSPAAADALSPAAAGVYRQLARLEQDE